MIKRPLCISRRQWAVNARAVAVRGRGMRRSGPAGISEGQQG